MKLFSRKPSRETLLAELQSAYELIQQNRLPQALALLNNITDQVPNNAKALELRGQVYGMQGNIPAALADLQKSVELKPTPSAYFNFALAHLHAQNKKAGLLAVLRALQLQPNDSEAWSLRDQLAKNLGMVTLDGIARVVERFMYSLCGPGMEWIVEFRPMHRFIGNGQVESYDAAVLDFRQQPTVFLQIVPISDEYRIIISCEKTVAGIDQRTYFDAMTRIIPSNDDALLAALKQFVSDGILVRDNNRLRYNGPQKSM